MGEVALGFDRVFAVAQLVRAVEIVVAIVIGMAEEDTKVLIKTMAGWIELILVTQMPFPADTGCITSRLEHFSEGRFARRQTQRVNVRLWYELAVNAARADDLLECLLISELEM